MTMKTTHTYISLMFLITVMLAIVACKKDEVVDQPEIITALLGDLIDVINFTSGGHYLYELSFKNDGTFTERSSSYGTYEEQDENELSGWFVRTGNFETHKNNLYCTFNKVVSWDSFYGGEPETTGATGTVFENCTYTIQNNTLELNYITYPADVPEVTVREYHRAEN